MCGIAGFYIRKPTKGVNINKLIDTLFDGIDHRGGDATGMALFGTEGLIDHQVATANAYVFTNGRRYAPRDTRIALLHTRLATQGHPAFAENNHPVMNQGVYAIHNGHISNDSELWKEIGTNKRRGEVDSEIIPAMIAQNGWENAVEGLEKLEGSFAIAAVHEDSPAELLLAKGEMSPLVYFYTDNILVWASTEYALIKAWGAAIGTPPKMKRLKALKFGQYLKIVDGEIQTGTFEVAYDWSYSWKNYNTTGKGTTNTVVYQSGKKQSKKAAAKLCDAGTMTVDDWLRRRAEEEWDKATLEEITAEIANLREQTNAIMLANPNWYEDTGKLAEFNSLWDRIRGLKEIYEDKAWGEIEARTGQYQDEPEMIACAACGDDCDLEEMSGYSELYCPDCWNFHMQGNYSEESLREGELQWKTIAPGTEVMVLVDRDTGEELE